MKSVYLCKYYVFVESITLICMKAHCLSCPPPLEYTEFYEMNGLNSCFIDLKTIEKSEKRFKFVLKFCFRFDSNLYPLPQNLMPILNCRIHLLIRCRNFFFFFFLFHFINRERFQGIVKISAFDLIPNGTYPFHG